MLFEGYLGPVITSMNKGVKLELNERTCVSMYVILLGIRTFINDVDRIYFE